MTTIDEFNKITETMYEKGYVMVSIYDMAKANDDGTMTPGEILLPPGKIPFVLSQDDVCYYHYMDGDGFATKLVVDDEGKVRNEYVEDDGSISVGDYDKKHASLLPVAMKYRNLCLIRILLPHSACRYCSRNPTVS